jgi:predicted RNA-binding Zn-ribbon protein involved in translation (DUF1610 family)
MEVSRIIPNACTELGVGIKKYHCLDCGYSWQVIFGRVDPGVKQACPKCKSLNIHRIDKIRGGARSVKMTSLKSDIYIVPEKRELIHGRMLSLHQDDSQTEDTSDYEA